MLRTFRSLLIAGMSALALPLMQATPALSAMEEDGFDTRALSEVLMYGNLEQAITVERAMVQRGKLDVIPVLVLAMRYKGPRPDLLVTFKGLTGEEITGWKDGMLWQEAHPEIVPHKSYQSIKLRIFENIDRNFLRFLGDDRGNPENLKIRLEEITWGGVGVDGIPSLDNPTLIEAAAADYMSADDLVFGIEINGDVRAYPLRIMGWHEMFNDVIGGVPVALAYCTLCGAGILFETDIEGRDEPLVFGSSGFLYRSNKLMFDRETDSLWNQFTGEPVSGPLRDSGIRLKMRPVTITSWKRWQDLHPDTKVLSPITGYARNYDSGVVYKDYFASPDLMFPTLVRDESQLVRKDYVFGIREAATAKAWPVDAFADQRIINDEFAGRNIVLVGDAATRTVRAYEREDDVFASAGDTGLKSAAGDWTLTEDALVGPEGKRLDRIAGHVSYWFAWDGYLGVDAELYSAN